MMKLNVDWEEILFIVSLLVPVLLLGSLAVPEILYVCIILFLINGFYYSYKFNYILFVPMLCFIIFVTLLMGLVSYPFIVDKGPEDFLVLYTMMNLLFIVLYLFAYIFYYQSLLKTRDELIDVKR